VSLRSQPDSFEGAAAPPYVPSMVTRLVSVLGRWTARRVVLAATSLGVLLTLPALWTGFAQDDFFFLMIFKGAPGLEVLDLGLTDTFSFSKGDPAARTPLMDRGYYPWWVADGWKINFCRPIASLSHWADYQFFGEAAWPMHAHSLILYGLLVAVAALLYRRFIPLAGGAALAAMLFAMDSGHAIPATWLAMRNALLALLFGLLVLYSHDRWRRDTRRWWPHGPLALLWLALALLSAEAAVAVGGYLLAYALFLDPAVRQPRRGTRLYGLAIAIAALLPYLAVVVAWRVAYATLGYGTEASGLYVDPVADAAIFLNELPARMAILMLGLFALPDAAVWSLAPAAIGRILLAGAGLFLVLSGWALWPLLRKRPEARFLLLGAILAMVPACATLPMDRNLLFASFGAMGVVGLYLSDQAQSRHGSPKTSFYIVISIIFVVSHLFVAPIGLILGTQQLTGMNRILTGSNPSIPTTLATSTRIVAINTPTDLLGASLPIFRAERGLPLPERWWWLYSGVSAVTVERTGDQSLILRPAQPYLAPTWAQVFRSPASQPLREGDEVRLNGLAIRVLKSTPEGRPTEVRFDFDVTLEDASLYFVTWQNGAYLPFEPPAVGATQQVPGPRLADMARIALGAPVKASQGDDSK
jgi:hypothetical protein